MKTRRKRTPGRYDIQITVEGPSLKSVERALKSAFGEFTGKVVKIERAPSRADRLAEASGLVQDAMSEVEDLHSEIESWKDGLPENLQNGDKASELEECAAALDTIKDNLDSVMDEMGQVSFPGMY